MSLMVDVFSDVEEAGMDRLMTQGLQTGNEGLNAIQEANERARQIGIEGMPFFIINGEIMFSGAQPPETFSSAFRHAIASE